MTGLTKEQILNIQAGDELDRLVAVHVMGWHRGINDGHPDHDCWMDDEGDITATPVGHFRPSTDIADAWRVVEIICTRSYSIEIGYQDELWSCVFLKDHAREWVGTTTDTVEVAICRAALILELEISE